MSDILKRVDMPLEQHERMAEQRNLFNNLLNFFNSTDYSEICFKMVILKT